jgi:rod shape determining protein RodA
LTTFAPLRRLAVGERVRHFLHRLDWLLLLGVSAITVFGVRMVDVSTRDDITGDPNFFAFRQLIYVAVGVGVMSIAMAVDLERLGRRPWALWGALVGAVTVVLVIGSAARGSRRWIDFGVFQFQPSEIGKVAMVVILAGLLVERGHEIGTTRLSLLALGAAALPAFIVFVQPDLGTSLVYFAILGGMLFFAGVPWKHFAAAAGAVAGLGLLILGVLPAIGLPVLKDYQVNRLESFIDSSKDPGFTGYQAAQSRIATGHGGAFGQGVDGATQVTNDLLPEHHTDFIFASLAEIFGFVGAALLILAFGLVIWRALRIMTRASSQFDQFVAGGIAAMFAFQVFVNIGMNVTIMPITGIPLPFMSYGGSHTLTNLIAVGILLRIHRNRGVGPLT